MRDIMLIPLENDPHVFTSPKLSSHGCQLERCIKTTGWILIHIHSQSFAANHVVKNTLRLLAQTHFPVEAILSLHIC